MKQINLLSPGNPPENEDLFAQTDFTHKQNESRREQDEGQKKQSTMLHTEAPFEQIKSQHKYKQDEDIITFADNSKKSSSPFLSIVFFLLIIVILSWLFYEPKQYQTVSSKLPITEKTHEEVRQKRKEYLTANEKTSPYYPATTDTDKTQVTEPSHADSKTAFIEEREYVLIIGSFSSKKNARKKLYQLKGAGIASSLHSIRVNQTVYLVYGGDLTNYKEAKRLQKKLRTDGFDTYMPSTKTNKYRVRTGVFTHKPYAQAQLRKLRKKNYKAQIETTQMSFRKYEIKIGNFQSYKEAKEQQNVLKAKGYETILLMQQRSE